MRFFINMEKSVIFHVLLVFVTCILSSSGGDAKGEVDMDILNKLKDSGALDNIKEELEKMLDEKEAKEGSEGDVPVAQAFAHIEGYVSKMGLKVTNSLMKALVKLRSESKSQADHFTVLEEVAVFIDKLLQKGPLNNYDDKLIMDASEKMTELVSQFPSVEKLRDMLQAQAKALNGLNDPNIKLKPKMKNEEKKKPEPTENADDSTSFSDGINPDTISQGVDMFVKMVKTNPDMIIGFATKYAEKYDYVSKKTLNMIASYAKTFAKSDYFLEGIDYFAESVTKIISTPGKFIVISLFHNNHSLHFDKNLI